MLRIENETWIARLLGKDISIDFPAPWAADSTAIYRWLATWPDSDGPLPAEAETLPDEPSAIEGKSGGRLERLMVSLGTMLQRLMMKLRLRPSWRH